MPTMIADQKTTLDNVPPTAPKFRSFRSSNNTVDSDIVAYKRVIWRHSDEYDFHLEGQPHFAHTIPRTEIQENVQHSSLDEPNPSSLKWPPRRSRGVQARRKPSQRARKSDNPSSVRRETIAITHENQANPIQNEHGDIGAYYTPHDPNKKIPRSNDWLQDYQIQLMRIEQQNKFRREKNRIG